MITVIIAGGSGTRLWPLSTPDYPKHLLNVNGQNKTLVQNTYNRVKEFSSKIYVITEAGHAHHIRAQLPELSDDCCIVEPARRGTASCILAGLRAIAKSGNNNEPIAFVAADHYIRDLDGFKHSFKIAEQISESENRIVLVGVEPDYPATGFGYIEKGQIFNEDEYVFNVKAFKEKPDFQTAKQYVKSGNYLWNCGYFVGSVNAFVTAMDKSSPELMESYEQLLAQNNEEDFKEKYKGLNNEAIDYALIEKVQDLLVVPASFDWMDLGSFADLHKAADSDEAGNHSHGEHINLHEVQNSFIQNHETKPLAVIGLDNIVVVNSPKGIVVARKDMSQAIGDIAKKIHAEQEQK